MFKSALFGGKRTHNTEKRPFKDFYNAWISTLATTLLPDLRRVLSSSSSTSPSHLSSHVDAIHRHFISYYDALDHAASNDVAQCLYPTTWRNSLETPFLWLGDLHPYLFTNLLRSFLDDQSSSSDSSQENDGVLEYDHHDRPWQVEAAWRSPSKVFTTRVDQIECGLRLMVPALAARARHAQARMVERVGSVWGKKEGMKAGVAEAVAAEMEEMVGVVVDANRLRRSILADVLSVSSVYQAALFLEALAQFLIGFRDEKLLKEFHKCQMAVN